MYMRLDRKYKCTKCGSASIPDFIKRIISDVEYLELKKCVNCGHESEHSRLVISNNTTPIYVNNSEYDIDEY